MQRVVLFGHLYAFALYKRMSHYRAYLLSETGRIFRGVDLNAENDIDAWAEARRALAQQITVELWHGQRFVGTTTVVP